MWYGISRCQGLCQYYCRGQAMFSKSRKRLKNCHRMNNFSFYIWLKTRAITLSNTGSLIFNWWNLHKINGWPMLYFSMLWWTRWVSPCMFEYELNENIKRQSFVTSFLNKFQEMMILSFKSCVGWGNIIFMRRGKEDSVWPPTISSS